jgi:hypothetical protein
MAGLPPGPQTKPIVSAGSTPEQIDAVLKGLPPEAQDQVLAKLPLKDIQAYADWSKDHNDTGGTQDLTTTELPGGGEFASSRRRPVDTGREPTDEEMKKMTNEQIQALIDGKTLDAGEVGPPPEEQGAFRRGVGITARAGLKGALAIPLAVFDKIGEVPGVTGSNDMSDALDRGLTSGGFAKPESAGERVYSDIVGGVAGGLSLGGAGALAKTAGGVGLKATLADALASTTGRQAIAGGIGGGAGGIVRENGGTPGEQLAASLIAGLSPSMGKTLMTPLIRRAIRGGKDGIATMKDNISTFENAGTFPSVGQATGGNAARGLEAALSRFYGSSGKMLRFGRGQEDAIGANIAEKVDALHPGGISPTEMGDVLRNQVEKVTVPGYNDMVGAKFKTLYKELPNDTVVPVPTLSGKLGNLTKTVPGAEDFLSSKVLDPNRDDWVDLAKNLQKSITANGGKGVPLEAIKTARSKIGSLMSASPFNVNVDTGQLKMLYGALSEDMRKAATAAGPKALKAFEDANAATTKFHNYLDVIKPVIEKNGGGDLVFTAAINGGKEGASKLETVYNSIPKSMRSSLSASIIQRMMRPAAGTGATQGEFSLQNFFKNYEAMSAEGRAQVFGNIPKSLEKDFDSIAKTANIIRNGREDFGSASKAQEGRTGMQQLLYPLVMVSSGAVGANGGALTAGTAALAGATVVAGSSRVIANAMTNPKFVHWLASTNNIPKSMLPSAINLLAQQAVKDHDDELLEVSKELQKQTQEEDQ